MGHERIGFLPRTKQWNRLTEQIAAYDGDVRSAKVIADQALRAIRDKYNNLPNDESFIKAIRFLRPCLCLHQKKTKFYSCNQSVTPFPRN